MEKKSIWEEPLEKQAFIANMWMTKVSWMLGIATTLCAIIVLILGDNYLWGYTPEESKNIIAMMFIATTCLMTILTGLVNIKTTRIKEELEKTKIENEE